MNHIDRIYAWADKAAMGKLRPAAVYRRVLYDDRVADILKAAVLLRVLNSYHWDYASNNALAVPWITQNKEFINRHNHSIRKLSRSAKDPATSTQELHYALIGFIPAKLVDV